MFESGGFAEVGLGAIALELVDPGAADDAELLDLAVGWARVAAQAEARRLAALARLARRPLPHGDEPDRIRMTAAEYAPAVPVSRAAAEAAVELGLTLTGDLPRTFAALRDGVIDLARARAIVDEIQVAGAELGAAERAGVEARVLARAAGRTAAQVRRDVRRELLAVDPAAAERRHRRRVAERSVQVQPGPDGIGYLVAHLPTDALALVSTCLDDLADAYRDQCHATGADPGTHDQRRADAFVRLFSAIAAGTPLPCDERGVRWWEPPVLPRRHGRRAQVVLNVEASTLTGFGEQPGELVRFGPVPASMARRLAAGASRVEAPVACTDERTGNCRHAGTRTPYVPSQRQRDEVIARDRHCRHPHCRRPASQCDVDHLDPHRADGSGGPTCPCNLVAVCRFHHRLKHRGGWTVTPLDPLLRAAGALRWTSPLGRSYLTPGRHLPGSAAAERSPAA